MSETPAAKIDAAYPEVLIGALANRITAESEARDACEADLLRSWHQGRVSAFMDAKGEVESWTARFLPPAEDPS